MSPSFPAYYALNCRFVHPKPLRYDDSGHPISTHLSNAQNLLLRKLCVSSPLAPWNVLRVFLGSVFFAIASILGMNSCPMIIAARKPSLSGRIMGIIFRRPNKQVVRTNAGGIVAFMTDKEADVKEAVMDYPRGSVGLMDAFRRSMVLKIPISVWINIPHPFPTPSKMRHVLWNRAVLVNLFPKSCNLSFKPSIVEFFRCHKTKHHRPMKVLSAHLEPQSSNDGGNVLSSDAFCGYNRATDIMPLNSQKAN